MSKRIESYNINKNQLKAVSISNTIDSNTAKWYHSNLKNDMLTAKEYKEYKEQIALDYT